MAVQVSAATWPLEFFTSDPKTVVDLARKIPVPEGADLFAIEMQLHCRAESDGRLSIATRTLIRVVTDGGAKQMNQYSHPWLAWRRDKPLLRVRVITPDGEAHLLDPKTITEAGIPSRVEGLFTDTKILAAPLPAVTKDALIEVEVQENDRVALGPSSVRFPMNFAAAHFRATFDAPANVHVHAGSPGIPQAERKDSSENGRQQISFDGSDLREPPKWKLRPAGVVEPAIVFSTAPDWQSVVAWYRDLAEPQIGEKQPAAPIDARSRMAEVAEILAQIQKTVRYTGVEFGMSAYVPRSPEETVGRGYGDCKDKSALLVNRLRKAGIAADLVLLSPYPGVDASSDFPGIEPFAHAIVYVPGPRAFFIDPTSEFTPAGRLPDADQGRMALIIDPTTKALTRIPADPPETTRWFGRSIS